MTELDIPAAEPVEFTLQQARELTDRIKAGVTDLLPLIKEAFERRIDRLMGYDSWSAYCDAELRGMRIPVSVEGRRAAVAELRETGMSTRAIGAALSVSEGTVRNDLSTAQNYAVEQPDRVNSLDGRQRPSSRPTMPEAPAESAVKEDEPTAASAPVEEPAAPLPRAPEQPTPERGRAAVQQMVEEERQKGEYLRNFRAALSKSSAWQYDAERVGREASAETFAAIEANVSTAVHWLETARKARSGFRVINGGRS